MRNFGNLTRQQAKKAQDKLGDAMVIFDEAGARDVEKELDGIMADLDAAFPGMTPNWAEE